MSSVLGCSPGYQIPCGFLFKKCLLFVFPSPHSKAEGPPLFADARGREPRTLQVRGAVRQDNLEQSPLMPIGRGALLLETDSRSHSEDQVEAGSRDQDACQRATAVPNPSDGSPNMWPLLMHDWGKQSGERSLQERLEPGLARQWQKRPRPSSWLTFPLRGFHERWWISPIKHVTAGLGSHRWKQR